MIFSDIPISKRLYIVWCSLQMERGKLDKGGYSSISGPRVIEKTFNDMSISGSRFGSGSGLGGLSTDMDSFASKPKGSKASLVFLDIYFTLERPVIASIYVNELKFFPSFCMRI